MCIIVTNLSSIGSSFVKLDLVKHCWLDKTFEVFYGLCQKVEFLWLSLVIYNSIFFFKNSFIFRRFLYPTQLCRIRGRASRRVFLSLGVWVWFPLHSVKTFRQNEEFSTRPLGCSKDFFHFCLKFLHELHWLIPPSICESIWVIIIKIIHNCEKRLVPIMFEVFSVKLMSWSWQRFWNLEFI